MSETKEQASVMIGYLFQIMYERGEMLRHAPATKDAERHAHIIHTLSRSIAILREDYGLYDRAPQEPQPQSDAPQPPPFEPAEWDQERVEIEEPKEI